MNFPRKATVLSATMLGAKQNLDDLFQVFCEQREVVEILILLGKDEAANRVREASWDQIAEIAFPEIHSVTTNLMKGIAKSNRMELCRGISEMDRLMALNRFGDSQFTHYVERENGHSVPVFTLYFDRDAGTVSIASA